jgi:hypothetical protein
MFALHKNRPKYFENNIIITQQSFLIHNNGARPFKVIINKSIFSIFKKRTLTEKELQNPIDIYETLPYDVPVMKSKRYLKVFIGKSKRNCKKENGNSILFQISKQKYIYVGSEIYQFCIDDVIFGYMSVIGNSDVPYPYAVGNKNTYLLLERTYLPNDVINTKDPYTKFYQQTNKLIDEHRKKHKILMTMIHENHF